MVLGLFSCEVIQTGRVFLDSLRMEGKEKRGTQRRGMGNQDQQDSHPEDSPSSSPNHWGGESLEANLPL